MSGTGGGRRMVTGWVAVLVALAGIGLVLAASRSGRTVTITPLTTASPSSPASPPTLTARPQESAAPTGTNSSPPPAIEVFYALLAAAVLALVGYLAWTWFRPSGGGVRRRRGVVQRRREPAPLPDPRRAEAFTEAVDAGLRRLAEGEPQDAVIACWVLLERAAAAAGTARRPAETPAELVARVLAEQAVTRAALDRLVGLYREARYSRHVLGEPARAEARTALEQVRRELAGRTSVG